ncbi:PRP38 family-domain-containing protein [Pyronema omphalodes]|nr:PRP38 family-domain-containing protein [Pyronema omphalodes]
MGGHDTKSSHAADGKALLDSRGLYEGETIHGGNPLLLVEKIIRDRILDSLYWKELCFGLNAATLLDRATELTYLGGTYSNQKPTPFICLLLKLLQLQPEKPIILAYLQDPDFKYLRCLAALYIRLTWKTVEIFQTLEPLMGDYRKVRIRGMGGWRLGYVDEFIDSLLVEERVCDIALPRMMTRAQLEDLGELEPRESLLGSEVESEGESDNEGDGDKDEETRGNGEEREGDKSDAEMGDREEGEVNE